MPDDTPPIVTAAEFARLVGAPPRTVERWLEKDSGLPCQRNHLPMARWFVPTLEGVIWLMRRSAYAGSCGSVRFAQMKNWAAQQVSILVRDGKWQSDTIREQHRTIETLQEQNRMLAKQCEKHGKTP